MFLMTDSPPLMVSPQVSWGLLGRVSCTLPLADTPFLMVSTRGTQPPTDKVKGRLREGGKGNPMRTGHAVSNQSVIGAVRDSEGMIAGSSEEEGGGSKLISLCLFIPDTLLNES